MAGKQGADGRGQGGVGGAGEPTAYGRHAPRLTADRLQACCLLVASGQHPIRVLVAIGYPPPKAKQLATGKGVIGRAFRQAWAEAIGEAERRVWEKRPDIWLKSGPAKGRGKLAWTEAARLQAANRKPPSADSLQGAANFVGKFTQLVETLCARFPENAPEIRKQSANLLESDEQVIDSPSK